MACSPSPAVTHQKVIADMSVLRVQGGRRLEGVVTVEGNKNAALPLIVASLLTTEPVTLHNVPRIRDVDVLLDLLEGLGSTVEGRGTEHARPARRGAARHHAGPAPGRAGPRVRAADGAAAGASRGGATGARRAATSRRAARSSTHVQALTALGARAIGGAAHAFDAPDGLRGASFYMDEASVTATELALLAAVTARGRDRDSPCRDRAARGRVVPAAHRDGRADRGRRHVAAARPRRAAAARRRAHPARRLHRGRDVGRDRRRHARRDRRARRRARGSRAHRQRAAADAGAVRADGQRRPRQSGAVRRHRAAGDGAVAGIPERHGEPVHRAGHAGRRGAR